VKRPLSQFAAQLRGGAELGGLGVECIQLVQLILFVAFSTSAVNSLRFAAGKFLSSWRFQVSMSRVSLAMSAIMHHARDGPGVAPGTERDHVQYSSGWLSVAHFMPRQQKRRVDDVGTHQHPARQRP
jgi:hypothetical protein